MKQKKIIIPSMDAAKEFVAAAGKCDFDIDVYYNHIVIDAKSILGVLSLDLTRELTVRMYGDNQAFEDYIDSCAQKNKSVA